MRGIGGTEVVFSRQVDRLRVGAYSAEQFQIEVGGLDYGFEMNGILGMDFLLHATAVINLGTLNRRATLVPDLALVGIALIA